MHARKLPRISEPSFDRDYGNGSSSSSSKSKSYRRSISPSDRSPRDRKYGRGSRSDRDYYQNKYRRERNRDRSPKERKWERRSDHRDHGRNNDRDHGIRESSSRVDQNSSTASLRSVGDWSEHTSSQGKKYYYNCVSEVSRTYICPVFCFLLIRNIELWVNVSFIHLFSKIFCLISLI